MSRCIIARKIELIGLTLYGGNRGERSTLRAILHYVIKLLHTLYILYVVLEKGKVVVYILLMNTEERRLNTM